MADENKESKVLDLMAEVADKISTSGSAVRERLVGAMVEKEVASRVSTLDFALQKRAEMLKELKKVDRPDNEFLDADGNVVQSAYSKDRLGAIKKAKEKLNKLEGAIEKALSSNDFSKLREVAKSLFA